MEHKKNFRQSDLHNQDTNSLKKDFRKDNETLNENSSTTKSIQLQEKINNSPKMIAEKERMKRLFGNKLNFSQDKGYTVTPPDNATIQNKEDNSTTFKQSSSPLPDTVRMKMENAFGADFSQVKIHENSKASDLGALAFTQGNNIHFAPGQFNPETQKGQELLGHELTHVIQQRDGKVKPTTQFKGAVINDDKALEKEADDRGRMASHGKVINNFGSKQLSGNNSEIIQGFFQPEDASDQMVGMELSVTDPIPVPGQSFSIGTGEKVKVTTWDNSKEDVTVSYFRSSDKKTYTLTISKIYLRPVKNSSGLKYYDAGIDSQASAVKGGKSKILELEKKEPEYKKYHNEKGYAAEHSRLEHLNDKRSEELNRKLIQETMYNRFDNLIVKWVDYYNKQFKPKDLLDANIIKSLLFQETQLGTSGQHLEKPPYSWSSGQKHPIRSKYNLGQAIDSWGPQQYLMIKEIAPAIYSKYHLNDLEKDGKWKSMSNNDYAAWNGGDFWKAMNEFSNFKDSSGNDLMGNNSAELYQDYEFWIRTAIRWIFEKYRSLKTPDWHAAVKAYNGSGSQADAYRDKIFKRAGK